MMPDGNQYYAVICENSQLHGEAGTCLKLLCTIQKKMITINAEPTIENVRQTETKSTYDIYLAALDTSVKVKSKFVMLKTNKNDITVEYNLRIKDLSN